jgi:Type-A lantibiotic
MSNQPEHENQQTKSVTPEEVRQSILAELEASQQAITELSDEELEEVAGGEWYGMYKTVNSGGGSSDMFKRGFIKAGVHTIVGGLMNNVLGGGQSQSQQW